MVACCPPAEEGVPVLVAVMLISCGRRGAWASGLYIRVGQSAVGHMRLVPMAEPVVPGGLLYAL